MIYSKAAFIVLGFKNSLSWDIFYSENNFHRGQGLYGENGRRRHSIWERNAQVWQTIRVFDQWEVGREQCMHCIGADFSP